MDKRRGSGGKIKKRERERKGDVQWRFDIECYWLSEKMCSRCFKGRNRRYFSRIKLVKIGRHRVHIA